MINLALLAQAVAEAAPQLVLQTINNYRCNTSLSGVALFSAALSAAVIITGVYRFLFQAWRGGFKTKDVPFEMTVGNTMLRLPPSEHPFCSKPADISAGSNIFNNALSSCLKFGQWDAQIDDDDEEEEEEKEDEEEEEGKNEEDVEFEEVELEVEVDEFGNETIIGPVLRDSPVPTRTHRTGGQGQGREHSPKRSLLHRHRRIVKRPREASCVGGLGLTEGFLSLGALAGLIDAQRGAGTLLKTVVGESRRDAESSSVSSRSSRSSGFSGFESCGGDSDRGWLSSVVFC
jgi:hypothetical protein